jgi:hypothetical protein
MTEFNVGILSRVILAETRIVDFFSEKHEGFRKGMVQLSYSPYSLRLMRMMFQLCPRSTLIVILGRFFEGLIPSIDLRIKGQFLDIVR